jgi:hypothetical protein
MSRTMKTKKSNQMIWWLILVMFLAVVFSCWMSAEVSANQWLGDPGGSRGGTGLDEDAYPPPVVSTPTMPRPKWTEEPPEPPVVCPTLISVCDECTPVVWPGLCDD